MDLEAPGNYSDLFWSNKISVLSCEGPKPQNAVLSGLLDPVGPLIIGFEYAKLLRTYTKLW